MNETDLLLLLNNIENIKNFLIALRDKKLDPKSMDFWVKAKIGDSDQIIKFLNNEVKELEKGAK